MARGWIAATPRWWLRRAAGTLLRARCLSPCAVIFPAVTSNREDPTADRDQRDRVRGHGVTQDRHGGGVQALVTQVMERSRWRTMLLPLFSPAGRSLPFLPAQMVHGGIDVGVLAVVLPCVTAVLRRAPRPWPPWLRRCMAVLTHAFRQDVFLIAATAWCST